MTQDLGGFSNATNICVGDVEASGDSEEIFSDTAEEEALLTEVGGGVINDINLTEMALCYEDLLTEVMTPTGFPT